MIHTLVFETYEELCQYGAKIIAGQMQKKPDSVLGLATGSSPIGIYKNLIQMNQAGEIDFSKITSVNLDEYVGLGSDHPQSYRYFMQNNLFDHVNIHPEKTFVPNGLASDLEAECAAYDRRIEELGGIDLQLLGIGLDGHIGFNEPDDHFTEQTHVVTLDPSTIAANARFFNSADEVPRSAVTMGVGTIMRAEKILLIANGKAKEEIVEKAIHGPITSQLPASILQLHKDATVLYSKK